jgi:hypothetical protein
MCITMNTYMYLFLFIVLIIIISFYLEHHTIEGFKTSNVNKYIKGNMNERFRNIRLNVYNPVMKKIKRYI